MQSVVNFTPQPLYPLARILASIDKETGWTLEPFCTFRLTGKSLYPFRDLKTRSPPSGCSVTIKIIQNK
jgi:hypothetical protein